MATKTTHKNIPDWWLKTHLWNCLLRKPDYGINAASAEYSDDLPAYLRITDISDEWIFLPEKKTSVNHINSKEYILGDWDIVFTRTGASVGKTYLYNRKDGELVFAGFLIRATPDKKKILPGFISAYSHTKKYWQWVKEVSTRSGQPGINSVEYASLSFLLPPLPEQNRIVAVLETWDRAIGTLTKKIEIKKQIKKGLTNQNIYKRKDSIEYSIDDLFDLGRGRVIARGEIEENSGIYPVYSSQTSNNGIFGNIDTYDFEGEYLTWTTDGAHAGRVFYRTGRFNCTNVCGTAKLKTNLKVNLYFVYSYLNYITKNYVSYVGNPKLMNGVFAKIQIKLPDIKEQDKIANILTVADNEITALEKKLTLLKDQKKYLLNNLITGEIRTPENLTIYS